MSNIIIKPIINFEKMMASVGLHKVNDCYHAIDHEANTKTCALNRKVRLLKINNMLGQRADWGWLEWEYIYCCGTGESLCMCGHLIDEMHIMRSKKDPSVQLALGSKCILSAIVDAIPVGLKYKADKPDEIKGLIRAMGSYCVCGLKKQLKKDPYCQGQHCVKHKCSSCGTIKPNLADVFCSGKSCTRVCLCGEPKLHTKAYCGGDVCLVDYCPMCLKEPPLSLVDPESIPEGEDGGFCGGSTCKHRCKCGRSKSVDSMYCKGDSCKLDFCNYCFFEKRKHGFPCCKGNVCKTKCSHGFRLHRSGTSKKGVPYELMACKTGTCEPYWISRRGQS